MLERQQGSDKQEVQFETKKGILIQINVTQEGWWKSECVTGC